MVSHATAAVLSSPGGEFAVKELELEDPGAGEILVRLVATGVCHTDLLARDQAIPFRFPGVLGHEGAGVVETVGPGVTRVRPGDHVVLSWPSCGACGNCVSGQPRYCLELRALAFSGGRPDGSTALRDGEISVHDHFFGQSSFSSHTITWERNAIKVPTSASLELLGPLGCGVASGAGAVLNALKPDVGSSLAVFGAGSVGMSAIMAARLAGCSVIIAIDRLEDRLQLALELGATHVVNVVHQDPAEAVRAIAPRGCDFSLECTGNMDVLRQAVEALPMMRGVCGLVGGSPPGTKVTLDHKMMLWGKRLQGILGGEGQAETFIPRLVELFSQGRFPLDRLATFYGLHQINEAVAASEEGKVLKPILLMS